MIKEMEFMLPAVNGKTGAEGFQTGKAAFGSYIDRMKKQTDEAGRKLTQALKFCDECFGKGQELLIMITEFTANTHISQYIGKFGLEEYFKHNKDLLFYERNLELMKEISDIEEE